jgi:succinate-semialdehyde dehydrogenase/glutarate-semialdehyde dehydrogenase
MSIATTNPATGEVLKKFEPISDTQLEEKLQRAVEAFNTFRKTTFASRAALMIKAAEILEADKEKFGRMVTTRSRQSGGIGTNGAPL